VLFAHLFSGTLLRQSLLHPASLARLQVVGVTLHFLDDVLRHNLALEPTKGVLQRLSLLQSNFCHTHHPQPSTISDILELTLFVWCSVRTNCESSASSTTLIKATLTPSNRHRSCRPHRHLLFSCGRLRRPHRLLPRLAPVAEGTHRQLPSDQKGLRRGILDVLWSWTDGTPPVLRHGTS